MPTVALMDEPIDSDRMMTADRSELKYVVGPTAGAVFLGVVAAQLPRHRFRGPDATILPGGVDFATTVYFDTPSRNLYREAASSDSSLKLRAREYYSVHPALTEVATDPRQLVRYTPLVWLELKYKNSHRVQKKRIGIPKRSVPEFFAHGAITAEMIDLMRPAHGEEAGRVLSEVASVCGQYEDALRTDCVVNYRRSAWQDDAGTLRITVDRGVTFFAPPGDLWTRDFALVREGLGAAIETLPGAVVEIKARGTWPAWLREALRKAAALPVAFSKFVAASRAVHG